VPVADLDARASAIAVRLTQPEGMRLLVADLGSPHDVLSWAIVNGGRRIAATIVWREVQVAELGSDGIVVAAPVEGRRDQFAGKHTTCGSEIGAATFGAVSRGVLAGWRRIDGR
jgi:hypothetical protein